MRQLFHTPVLHFDDANGRPLVGGRLYSYKAGTSTPVNLFRNETGNEVHTNPIVLNMRGECVAYGVEGLLYKLVLKDRHDVTIWEMDNVGVSTGEGGGSGEDIYEIAMFDLSQAGHNLYDDIDANLGAGLLPIIYTGSQGRVRYYYYTARDSQAHTMTFTCGYDGSVELLVLKNDDTYTFKKVGSDYLIAKASAVEGDDSVPTKTFKYTEMSKVGDGAFVDANNDIRLKKGVYHVSIVVNINVNPTEESRPWIEEVSLNLPTGYGGVSTLLDRSIRIPHSSSSPLVASFDYVVETDNTLFSIHLAGLGDNCYATLKPISIHKIAEVE